MASSTKRRAAGDGAFARKVYSLRNEKLVAAAQALTYEGGCRHVRIEDVAACCGVAKGTSYRHFSTKEELLSAAVSATDTALEKHINAVATGLPGHEGLKSAATAALLSIIRNLRGRLGAEGAPSELPWPCCLEFSCCPFGGAPRSLAAIRALAAEATGRDDESLRLALELVLSVPVAVCTRVHVGGESQPSPDSVIALALEVLASLVERRQ